MTPQQQDEQAQKIALWVSAWPVVLGFIIVAFTLVMLSVSSCSAVHKLFTPEPEPTFGASVLIRKPTIVIHSGWRLTPTVFVQGCGTQRSFIQLNPHTESSFIHQGCTSTAEVIATQLPGVWQVQCDLVIKPDSTFYIHTYKGNDTDCRARSRKDGSIGFVYNLKPKYRGK